MSGITQRITRTTQPQNAVGIDWSNPITSGLTSATLPAGSNLVDMVGGRSGTGSTTSKAFVSGMGVVTGAGSYQTFVGSKAAASSSLTVLILATPTASLAGLASCGTAASTGWNLDAYGVTGYTLTFTAYGVVAYSASGVGPINGQNVPYMFGFSFTPNTTGGLSYYTNGKVVGSRQTTTGFNVSASQSLLIGASNAGSNAFTGGIHLALVFNRALSDAEIASLSANPWQIFAPNTNPIWGNV